MILLAACASSPPHANAASDAGDAARIICAAECSHEQRCAHNDPECPGRCAKLPVRHPAVWSAAWAGDIARCFAAASCEHDADELCVFATSRHTAATDACYASTASERRMCPVLNGLTADAAERARACFAGRRRRRPPADWK